MPTFVREKTVNGYTYLYLVESVRENGRIKQRIIRNLGRKEAVLASGALGRLIASIGRSPIAPWCCVPSSRAMSASRCAA